MSWSRFFTSASACLAFLACSAPEEPPCGGGADTLQLGALEWVSDESPVHLTDRSLCTASSEVIVVRVSAAWCGSCAWQVEHGGTIFTPAWRDRVRVLDLLVEDRDGAPATVADLGDWRARSEGAGVFAIDPEVLLKALFPERGALPWYAIIDAPTLEVRRVLTRPSAPEVTRALAELLQEPAPEPALFDGRFTADQQAAIAAMALGAPPPEPSNRVADDPVAAAFGERLFFDDRLSPAGVSCASCHVRELLFTNGKERAPEGTGPGTRNVPSLILASHGRWQLWDGRADTLWMQATLPIEDAAEFGSTRLRVAHAIATGYADTYEQIFGALPPLSEETRFPADGKPGDAAWEAMTESDREAVTRVLVNVGKSLAAFERSMRPRKGALDAYAEGRIDAFDDRQKDGLQAFFAAGCASCHHGPRLTDDAFHNLRFPSGRPDRVADPGRSTGVLELRPHPFARGGAFDDEPGSSLRDVRDPALHLGDFKTPGLRGVAFTLPYGHGGSFGGLFSVIRAHAADVLPANDPLTVGERDLWIEPISDADITRIEVFLRALRIDLD